MQDSLGDNSQLETIFLENTIQIDDILKIDIKTESPETSFIFNNNQREKLNESRESMILNGYQVDSNGEINFPAIGKIKALGLTIIELSDKIYDLVVKDGQLLNPIVDIKLLNAQFVILGEVNKPGKYTYDQNNMDILQAIGLAGDLTINGKRDDIKLIRDLNGKKIITNIDITNTDFISGKFFQIRSGDIIIVNPNSSRIKNAGIIGNSGTLLSLLSFILSSIIVISN